MKLIGIPPRATQAQQALNRLHHEVMYAVEGGELAGNLTELAEALAIAVQIGRLIDKALPEGHPERIQFENALNFMQGLHEYPR
jgi:hypothetical protein